MKRVINGMAVLLIILMLCAQGFVAAVSAGNTQSTATEVKAGKDTYYGTIHQGGVGDWYYINIGVSDGYHTFTIHNESGTENLYLKVYSARGEEVLDVGSYTSAGEEDAGTVRLLCNNTYYIHVYMGYEGTGNYYLKISKLDDLIGNSKETAKTIGLNEAYESTIDGEVDTDCFRFVTADVEQPYRIKLENLHESSGIVAEIYTSREEKLYVIGGSSGWASHDAEIVTLDPGVAYYAIVKRDFGDGIGRYRFEVSQCADGHTVSEEWIVSKEPTCTEKGEEARLCTMCKKAMKTKPIRATGHSVEEWTLKEPSTWKSLGKKEGTCTACGEIQEKHDFTKAWIIPAGALGALLLIIGIVNYIKSYGRSR